MCLVNLGINSNKTLLRNCHQNNGLLRITKQSPQPPPARPQHSKLGCFLFLTDSSSSSTTLHGADGGGNATFFLLFEGRRTSEKALLIFLPIAQLLFSQVLCSNDH